MPHAVVLAKLAPPRLHAVSARPRLYRRLDVLSARGVAWVEGPPGAGKTTLVASWLEARRARALWYRVDEADGDVATFFHYLGEAARRMSRGRAPGPRYRPDQALDLSAFARHWFRALHSGLRDPLTLVLDDYHAAPAALHTVVRSALEELPEGSRAIVLSRAGPPPAFARLGAGGKLARLAPGELSLDAGESRALLRLRGVTSRGAADALHARSGGWAAGLTLLLAARSDCALAAHAEDAVRDVFDYFAGEVLDRSDPTVQRVLLETALLPEVSAAAARSITGAPRADQILADLARRGYFTTRHGGAAVYRFHPLFREFLVERARQALPPARLDEVRAAAARAAADSGALADAVALLCDAGAHAGAASLVLEHAAELLDEGRAATLRSMLLGLPPPLVGADPWLSYWLGMSYVGCDLAQARPALERAHDAFVARGEASGAYLACAALLDTSVYDWTDFRPLERWIAAFGELRRRWPEIPGADVAARVACSIFGALMSVRPDDPDLPAWQERVVACAADDSDGGLRAQARFALAHFAIWRGDLAAARAALGPARPRGGRDATLEIGWRVQAARAAATSGNGAAAVELAEDALALAAATGDHWWDPGIRLVGAWGATILGEPSRAGRYLRDLEQEFDPTVVAYFEQARGLTLLRSGQPSAAREHLERSLSAAQERAAIYPASWDHVALAAVALAGGDADALERHLAEAERLGAVTRSHVVRYWTRLLRSAQLAAIDRAGAARAAGEALRASREVGPFDAMWIDEGVLARACALTLEVGLEVDEARALVRRHRLEPPDEPCDAWPFPIAVRTLGAFRLERGGLPASHVKPNARPLRLLKALVSFGGVEVPEWRLTDALWPDAEADAAQHALEMNLSRLRALLGVREAILQRDRKLSLDPRVCWVDAIALERWLASARAPSGTSDARCAARRLLSLYGGPFLPDEEDGWAGATRERLRRRTRSLADGLVRALQRAGEPGEAQAFSADLARLDAPVTTARVAGPAEAV